MEKTEVAPSQVLSDSTIVKDQVGTNSGAMYKYVILFLLGVIALSAVFGLIKKSYAVLTVTAVGVLVSAVILYFVSRPIRACMKAMRQGKFNVVLDSVKDVIVSPDNKESYVVEFASSEMIYETKHPMNKGDKAYLIIAITPKGLYSCSTFYPASQFDYVGEKEVFIPQPSES